MKTIKVDYAVFGDLKSGNEINGKARDVKSILQRLIDQNNGIVSITNTQMEWNTCLDNIKSFGAQIQRAGKTYYFSCQEGQTIDFKFGGTYKIIQKLPVLIHADITAQ